MTKRIVVCVDDFGLKHEVNRGVADLVDAGLVTATGCMSQGPAWREGAALLRGARRDRLDVGLHLNLTESFPLPPGQAAPLVLPLPQLMVRAFLRSLDRQALRQTIASQLDDFEAVWGEAPDFVDGHQHVHQLPQVRELLLDELQRRYGPASSGHLPWLRLTRAPQAARLALKPRVIEALGSKAFAHQAHAAGFQLNGQLLGVYGFDEDAAGYAHRVQDWLGQAQDGDVLMIHPACPAAVSGQSTLISAPAVHPDPIAIAREVEYKVWLERGRDLLGQAGVQGGRIQGSSCILPA